MKERDVSDLAFLSEATIRTSKSKKSGAETKKMLKELRKQVFKKNHRYLRVLREIEATVDNAADKMQKKNQSEYPPDLADQLLRDDNPDKKMAGQTLNWNLQNLESQKRKSSRISKSVPRY